MYRYISWRAAKNRMKKKIEKQQQEQKKKQKMTTLDVTILQTSSERIVELNPRQSCYMHYDG